MQTINVLEIGEEVYYFAHVPKKGSIKSRNIRDDGSMRYFVIDPSCSPTFMGHEKSENEIFTNKGDFKNYLIKLVNEL